MRYMLLIYGDENALTPGERDQCYRDSTELAHQLHAAGQFLATAPLFPTPMATSIQVRGGTGSPVRAVAVFEERART